MCSSPLHIKMIISAKQWSDFQSQFQGLTRRDGMVALEISRMCMLKSPCVHGSIHREIMELSVSDSQPCSSKWDELQSKCSGHCSSIDYQWKMSDSLSRVSVFYSATHSRSATHKHTTELNFALSLNSFTVWQHFQNVYAQAGKSAVNSTYCTWWMLQTQFPIYTESPLQRMFVEHTVSFIGQTLNLKAWWGVYWSPDPVLCSLNWFMDSISGARGAGVHVSVHTRLTGIHHTDQVSSAFLHPALSQDPCRCCWLTAQPDLRQNRV